MYFSSDAHIYTSRSMTSLREYICTLQVTPIPSVLPWMCVTKSIYFPINGDTQEVHFDLSLQNNTGVTQEVRMYFLSDAQILNSWEAPLGDSPPSLDIWLEIY